MTRELPFPPETMAHRAGGLLTEEILAEYIGLGRNVKRLIESQLPADWSWEGTRTLDFGCSAGRVLRQFEPETEAGEFWGCDIDEEAIAWVQENLSPPFHAFTVKPTAEIAQPDGFFNLIYAISVFTHITDQWSGWLLEMHRTLAPGGLVIASFLGEGMIQQSANEEWDGDLIGMNVIRDAETWDRGGPIVFHSAWWLREHWGRAFEIVHIQESTAPDGRPTPGSHGIVVLRKREGSWTREELEAPSDDLRERAALLHNLEQLHAEDARMRSQVHHLQGVATQSADEFAALGAERDALQSRIERSHQTVEDLKRSLSWRLTQPLRLAKQQLAERRAR